LAISGIDGAPCPTQSLARACEVGRALDERQRDEIDSHRNAEPKVVDVLVGDPRDRQLDTRRVNALSFAELAAIHHDGLNCAIRRRHHLELHAPIVQEEDIPGPQDPRQLRDGR
jgi:hypothetical protein